MKIKDTPLYAGTVTITDGVGTIPAPAPSRSVSPGSGVAIIVCEADAHGILVYDPADTVGHTFEAVAEDAADFVLGVWRWGQGGDQLPLTLKTTATEVEVMIVEVIE